MKNAVLLIIDGMDGEACADRIDQLLSDTAGVSEVRVSLLAGQASLALDSAAMPAQQLLHKLAAAGYPARAASAPGASPSGCCGGCCGA